MKPAYPSFARTGNTRWKRLLAQTSRLALSQMLGAGLLMAGSIALAAEDTEGAVKLAAPNFPQISSFRKEWPKETQAPAGAPNVLVILTDDVGFAASSTFGGVIPTPTLDALAHRGLRYTDFNTAAICSPTRASLLTGRNPHSINHGSATTGYPTSFDGYTSDIPKSAATIAEILKQNGYNTSMFGKSHLTPEWEQSQIGPFDRWPTGLGFEYFYGFINADTDQFSPALVEGTTPIQPPANDPNYILDRDLADRASHWIRQQHALAPAKPFFLYYATGSTHAPHQAPREWIEKYKGKFDQGWDRLREDIFARQKALGIVPANTILTPRPQELPAWESLPDDEKRLAARFMEVYAAELSFADDQIGRVIETLRETGQIDNTLIVFIEGDNGASGEGGPHGTVYEQTFITGGLPETFAFQESKMADLGGPSTYENYPAGWAWAMDTPFQWFKQIASHFGGTRDGMVVSWPARIKDFGGIRPQFSFVADVMPTILDAVGITPPKVVNGIAQQPIDGTSLVYSFADAGAKSRHRTQYFEMLQNVGIYQDGWLAATRPVSMPWDVMKPHDTMGLAQRDWELYNVDEDFSEATDLAQKFPRKLAALQRVFIEEGKRNHVFPVHALKDGTAGRPSVGAGRTAFSYSQGISGVFQDAAPHIANHSFTITADVELPDSTASGVLIAQGGRFGGYSFYLKDGHPAFCYNAVPPKISTVRSESAVSEGHHILTADFAFDGGAGGAGGWLTLSVDGQQLTRGRIEHTIPRNWISQEGLDIGQDRITPVSEDYIVPAKFSGRIEEVTVNIK